MLRLTSPAEFFQKLSEDARLKFELTWLTFGGLVVPAAILMTLGVPEKQVLAAMLLLTLPFQYVSFCVLQASRQNKTERLREGISETPVIAGLEGWAAETSLLDFDLPRSLESGVGTQEADTARFANVLRCILRQDPDVILAGELRDAETREILFKALLAGHPVTFSSHLRSYNQAWLEAIARLQGTPLDKANVIRSQRSTSVQSSPAAQEPFGFHRVIRKNLSLLQGPHALPHALMRS